MNDTSRVRSVEEVYGSALAEEGAFADAPDQSLSPGSGCLPGRSPWTSGHARPTTASNWRRFGFTVHGVEPVRCHLDNAARTLGHARGRRARPRGSRPLDEGIAERLGEPDGSVDLIWCREERR
jgi:hypothetical protein